MNEQHMVSKASVTVDENGVMIRDHYEREVVMWDIQEFADDPIAAIAACNAIHMFYSQGVDAVAKTMGRNISNPGFVLQWNFMFGRYQRIENEDLLP